MRSHPATHPTPEQLATVKHTPGPWSISSVSIETGAIGIAKDRILIAEAHNGYSFMDVVSGQHPAEQWANARLIEAAPELLTALRSLAGNAGALRAFEHEIRAAVGHTNWQCLVNAVAKADAAIAKATGAA